VAEYRDEHFSCRGHPILADGMTVELNRELNIAVPKQSLHGLWIGSDANQERCQTVAKVVEAEPARIIVRESAVFGRHHTLILYSFMYGPEREAPCPMCTHLLDSVNGGARHVGQRASLYIVAKSPIARLVGWARERGWDDLDFLSTAGNSYDADYFGDTSKLPAAPSTSAAQKILIP